MPAGVYALTVTDAAGCATKDSVTVGEPDCEFPGSVLLSNITSTSIQMDWTLFPHAINTQIQYRINPTDGGGGQGTVIVPGNQNQRILTGLQSGRLYQSRVRHNCAPGILSQWRYRGFITAAAREANHPANFRVFPNPVVDELNVVLGQPFSEKIMTLTVTDVLGNEVYSAQATEPFYQISTDGWRNGAYILTVTSDEKRWVEKVVVLR